jgi:hypothetical protein
MNIHPRLLELTINTDINAFRIKNVELFNAIAEEVSLETVTNHELMEIFFIVSEEMKKLNWKEYVRNAVDKLPFGLNQTLIAWDGFHPCTVDVLMRCLRMMDIVTIGKVAKHGRYMNQGCDVDS